MDEGRMRQILNRTIFSADVLFVPGEVIVSHMRTMSHMLPKQRPAIVVSRSDLPGGSFVLVATLSSNQGRGVLREEKELNRVLFNEWKPSGLEKPSYFQFSTLSTIHLPGRNARHVSWVSEHGAYQVAKHYNLPKSRAIKMIENRRKHLQ